MPSEPVSMAATSESTSPNRLSVTITSNCLGLRTSCIAPSSASRCSSCHVREFAPCTWSTTSSHSTPDFMTLRLSAEVTLFCALPGELEGDAGDALDLVGVVDLRVDGALLAVAEIGDGLGLAEIDAAGQLADDDDVEALDQLALERRGIGERRIADRRTQIGEQAEILAQPQQARPPAARRRAPRPTSARRPRRRSRRRRPAPSPCRRR